MCMDEYDVHQFCVCLSIFTGEARIEWFPTPSTQERSRIFGEVSHFGGFIIPKGEFQSVMGWVHIYIYINICHIWTLLSKQTTDFFLTFTYGEFDGMKHCWLHLYFVLYTSVVSWICATYVHSGASQSPVVANKMTFYMQTNMPWSVWTKQTLFQVFLVAEWLKKKRVVKTIELGEIPLSNRTSVQRIRIVIIKFIKNN